MNEMYSPLLMIAFMALFLVVAGGAYLAVRLMGAHQVDSDHPSARTRRP